IDDLSLERHGLSAVEEGREAVMRLDAPGAQREHRQGGRAAKRSQDHVKTLFPALAPSGFCRAACSSLSGLAPACSSAKRGKRGSVSRRGKLAREEGPQCAEALEAL